MRTHPKSNMYSITLRPACCVTQLAWNMCDASAGASKSTHGPQQAFTAWGPRDITKATKKAGLSTRLRGTLRFHLMCFAFDDKLKSLT